MIGLIMNLVASLSGIDGVALFLVLWHVLVFVARRRMAALRPADVVFPIMWLHLVVFVAAGWVMLGNGPRGRELFVGAVGLTNLTLTMLALAPVMFKSRRVSAFPNRAGDVETRPMERRPLSR